MLGTFREIFFEATIRSKETSLSNNMIDFFSPITMIQIDLSCLIYYFTEIHSFEYRKKNSKDIYIQPGNCFV